MKQATAASTLPWSRLPAPRRATRLDRALCTTRRLPRQAAPADEHGVLTPLGRPDVSRKGRNRGRQRCPAHARLSQARNYKNIRQHCGPRVKVSKYNMVSRPAGPAAPAWQPARDRRPPDLPAPVEPWRLSGGSAQLSVLVSRPSGAARLRCKPRVDVSNMVSRPAAPAAPARQPARDRRPPDPPALDVPWRRPGGSAQLSVLVGRPSFAARLGRGHG